jgi:hypothetical protein
MERRRAFGGMENAADDEMAPPQPTLGSDARPSLGPCDPELTNIS